MANLLATKPLKIILDEAHETGVARRLPQFVLQGGVGEDERLEAL